MTKDDFTRLKDTVRGRRDRYALDASTPTTVREFDIMRGARSQAAAVPGVSKTLVYVLVAAATVGVFYLLLRFGDNMFNWFANFGNKRRN